MEELKSEDFASDEFLARIAKIVDSGKRWHSYILIQEQAEFAKILLMKETLQEMKKLNARMETIEQKLSTQE